MRTPSIFTFSLLALFAVSPACRSSGHPVAPSALGESSSTADMIAHATEPGPIELTTVVSANWEIARSGLINLDHAEAKRSGLEDGAEPIEIYFHVLRHPTRGTFLVDTGVETKQRTDPDRALLRGLVGAVMNLDKLVVKNALGEWLRANHVQLSGVLLTHFHLDHVSGMRDVPKGTPIYMGPGETEDRSFQNLFVAPIMNEAMEGQNAISEWQFAPDPSGSFAGIIDIFGDASVFAIHVPGHTPGSTAYLARTARGPVLLVGDASHTRWGWEHGVEPGSFSSNQDASALSLARLRALVSEHPVIDVRLGHQGHLPESAQPAENVGPETRDLGHRRPLGVELDPLVTPHEDAS